MKIADCFKKYSSKEVFPERNYAKKDGAFSSFADIFTIFAENFNAMKLSKDQRNLLKGSLAAWAGMVVALVLFAIFGKRTWSDTLSLILGVTIAEILVGLFMTLGSRVSEKKNDDN